jgi:hypothetical protein
MLEMTWGDSHRYCYWPLTNNENIEIFVRLATCTKICTAKWEEHCIQETKQYKWIRDANREIPRVVWTQNNVPSGTPHTKTLAQIEGQALFVPIATHGKVYTVELVSLRCRALLWLSLLFWLNVTLMLLFNFTVLLSYCAICMFLVQKISCPVATHGYAT